MGNPLGWLDDSLQELRDKKLYNNIRAIESPQGAWLTVDGRNVLNFCSNNYLGLANNPRLKQAAKDAIDKYGIGPAAVRTIAGTMSMHIELEKRLAAFKEAEAAIVFQSGFTSNLGTIPALVGPGDVIFSDALNHASIIDGCRLSRAENIRYDHISPESLKAQLQEKRSQFTKAIIITDGVFSMDGDIAPLPELAELAREYDCMMMVDDAHGEGVMGHGGRGIVHHFGLQGKIDVEVGTLSKAFGVVGGYIAGKANIVEWLRQRARPFLFSSALTVPDTAACLEAVHILEESEALTEKLWENTHYFKEKMQTLGFNTGKSVTPITPILLGAESLAQTFSQKLFAENVFAMAIAFPTVLMGTARIRVMISAAHSKEDLDFGVAAFTKIGKETGVLS